MSTPRSQYPVSIQLAKKLALLLDSSFPIPFTKHRIGLDPVLGALPWGDVITLLLSFYIVAVAVKEELPPRVVYRMLFNVTIDALMSAVPVLGDLLDVGYKANLRNLVLLEEAFLQKNKTKASQQPYVVIDVSPIR